MLNKEICSSITFSRESLCNSTVELLQSKDFYLLTELYCSEVSEQDKIISAYLSYYFEDEGYVDCWRIPHLMLDIYNKSYQFNEKTLESPNFLPFFFNFLLGFYDFCMTVYKPFLLNEWAYKSENDALFQMSICRHQMNLIVDTFSVVIENIKEYKTAEKIIPIPASKGVCKKVGNF